MSQPPAPPDFSGKATVMLKNLTFDNSSCSGSWPSNGTIKVNSNKNIYTYDFSINSNGSNCGCANVSVNGGSATLDCNLSSAQPVYLSLSSMRKAQSPSKVKSPIGQMLLIK